MNIEQIKAARASGALSVTELARRVGRTRQTIHRILAGEIDPPLSLAQRMAAEAAAMIAEREKGKAA